MGLFTTSKSPEQIIAEEEGELAAEVWNLIEEEGNDLEKLRQLEQQAGKKDITRAERALESLAVGIENDLEKIREEVNDVEKEETQYDLDSSFQKAAEHNLKLVESALRRLKEEDNNLEKWLKMTENESPEEEVQDLIEIEEKIESDLKHIEMQMKEGGEKNRGWIDLQQFNP